MYSTKKERFRSLIWVDPCVSPVSLNVRSFSLVNSLKSLFHSPVVTYPLCPGLPAIMQTYRIA